MSGLGLPLYRRGPREASRDAVTGSRYTRTVSWKQRIIGVVVVTVLTGLPLAGTVCALVCAAPGETSTAQHHGAAEDCRERPASASSSGVQMAAVPHPCGDHNATGQSLATLTPVRADVSLLMPPAVLAVSQISYPDVPPFGLESAYSPPPGIAPPTSTPVVLRV